jgi:hypothetical protein
MVRTFYVALVIFISSHASTLSSLLAFFSSPSSLHPLLFTLFSSPSLPEHPFSTMPATATTVSCDDEIDWEWEDIIEEKVHRGHRRFRLKWKDSRSVSRAYLAQHHSDALQRYEEGLPHPSSGNHDRILGKNADGTYQCQWADSWSSQPNMEGVKEFLRKARALRRAQPTPLHSAMDMLSLTSSAVTPITAAASQKNDDDQADNDDDQSSGDESENLESDDEEYDEEGEEDNEESEEDNAEKENSPAPQKQSNASKAALNAPVPVKSYSLRHTPVTNRHREAVSRT